jgi:hypothetical protein
MTDQFSDSGFDSFNIMDNLQYFLAIGAVFALVVVSLGLLTLLPRFKRRSIKKLRKIRKNMIWNGLISSLNLTYLRSFISFTIAMLYAIWVDATFTKLLLNISQIVIFSLFIIFPIWTAYFLLNHQNLENKKVQEMYHKLYQDLKTNDLDALKYPLIFLMRRVFFTLIALTLVRFPAFQVQLVNMMNYFYIIYIGQVKPFKLPKLNRLEMFNEWTI